MDITINEITDMGLEETRAAIEELESLGHLTSTQHERPVSVCYPWGEKLTAQEAVEELKAYWVGLI